MKLSNENNSQKTIALLLFSGTQLAVTCLLGLFLGSWLDEKISTSPVFTLIFSFTFTIVAFMNFLRTVKKVNKK